MGSAVVESEMVEEQDGAAVEGAEATHTMAHLFQFSAFVHAGTGAPECEHAEDGRCKDKGHFHAWICLPNSVQNHDIQEKARAAKARHRRSMREDKSDAYAILEAELDDLMVGPRDEVLDELATREQLKILHEIVLDVREGEERFEHYLQDAEEYKRLGDLPEEERGDEYTRLHELMSDFTAEVEKRSEGEKARELDRLGGLPDDAIRDMLRELRIEGETAETHARTYYLWMAFVCTRRVGCEDPAASKRYFATLEDFRNASPEAVQAIDDAVRDLEARFVRGEAAGN